MDLSVDDMPFLFLMCQLCRQLPGSSHGQVASSHLDEGAILSADLQVVIFGAKAHTAVNESDAKLLLTGSAGVAEQPGTFGKGWLMVEQLASDTMTTCSKFLSLQLRLTNPLTATKEMRRKYFISPVLVAAGFLAGELAL